MSDRLPGVADHILATIITVMAGVLFAAASFAIMATTNISGWVFVAVGVLGCVVVAWWPVKRAPR